MLDLENAPEASTEPENSVDGGGMDDMFVKLHRELQRAKVEKLKAYFAKTPTPVARITTTVSGLVLLHLSKCWNKPEEHDGGDPCACVRPDGSHFFRCQHKNCKGLTWKDVEAVYGPLDPPPEAAKASAIKVLTCQELNAERFERRELVENTLVAEEHDVWGGAPKTMKTTLAIDLALSLGSGEPFLGRLAVRQKSRVLFCSGETGLGGIQDTARRIARAKGFELADLDNVLWSEWLPRFDNAKHLDMLARLIDEKECEVLFIDPCYLAMPGADAANLFIQGSMLRRIGDLCQQRRITLILLHHTRKRSKGDKSFDPAELSDLSWSGFGEFARQWHLLSRRESYEPGSGRHHLWLSLGGSAGHSALWAVDVEEGAAGEPRRWEVSISSPTEARDAKRMDTKRQRLIAAAREFPAGATKSDLVGQANVRNDVAINAVLAALVSDGIFETCKVSKNGASFDGYRLAPNIVVCAS